MATSIGTYLSAVGTGNSIVNVTEPSLTGASGNFNATPDTTGSQQGYSVLVATNPAGCVLDATAVRMQFQSGAKRLILVNFVPKGRIDVAGQDIIFWYPTFTHPGVDVSKIPGPNAYSSSLYNSPDGWNLAGSTRFGCYGFDGSLCADIYDTSGATAAILRGGYTHDQYPSNSVGGTIYWHSDTLDGVASGKTTSLTALDCTFTGVKNGQHGATLNPAAGHSYALSLGNTWFTGFNGNAVDIGGGGTCSVTFVDGNVYMFNNVNNLDTGATVTGTYHSTTPTSSKIGTDDPAAKWKAANPLASWPSFFPFLGGAGTTVPGAPINVTTNPGNGLVVVNFSAPASDGGATIDQYRATLTPGGGSNTGTGSARTINVAATNGTTYTATVAAHNSKGFGGESVASNPSTPTGASAPGTPSISVVSIADVSVSLAWTAAAPNGAAIDAYRVTVTWTASGGGTITRDYPSDALGGTVPGLVASRAYTVVVKAHNSVNYGSNSSSVGFTTLATALVKHWSDSIGGTEGTVEALSPAQQSAAWADMLAAGVKSERYDLNVEAFRASATTADAVINRMLAAGITDILFIVNNLGNGTWPNHSTLATQQALFASIATHFRTLCGSTVNLSYEFINEHNFTMTPRSMVEYAYWFKACYNSIKGADSTALVGTGGLGHVFTNKPPTSQPTPQVSNVYGQPYNSSNAQQWSETDAIADHCNTAVVGATFELQNVGCDFVGMHCYCEEQGPYALFGASIGNDTPNVVVNGMREPSRVDKILTAHGISAPIWITEVGFPHAPSWVLGKSYAVDQLLFDAQGSPNGTDLWFRPTLYICTAAHIATTGNRPSAPGSPWRQYLQSDVSRVQYSGFKAANAIATENEAAFHLNNLIRIVMGNRADADLRRIGTRFARIYIFTPRSWPNSTGFQNGLTDANGNLFGSPTSSGPLATVSGLTGALDTRGVVIAVGAGWEAIGSIPTGA